MKKRIVLCLLVLALPEQDILVDYRDYFSEEELAAFIPAFREESFLIHRFFCLIFRYKLEY